MQTKMQQEVMQQQQQVAAAAARCEICLLLTCPAYCQEMRQWCMEVSVPCK
jgi:hypothetical protein